MVAGRLASEKGSSLRTRDFARSSEIIVGALALTISLEFEIFEEKLKSMAAPFHDKQPGMQSELILFQKLH